MTDKPIPALSEALDHLHELRWYVEGQANMSDSLFQALNMLHKFALLQNQFNKTAENFKFFKKM